MEKKQKNIVDKLNKKIEEKKKNILQKNSENTKKDSFKEMLKKNKVLKRVLEFIEAIIYIICIIVVIFANFYGPIYIKMIPLLFILGIVGKIIYNRPVTTTVFGMLVSICVVYTTGVTNISQNLIVSVCMAMYIALGEICGFAIKKSYLYIKKKTKRKTFKAFISYFILIITFVTSLGIYNYTNSNYLELEKTTQRLNKYLETNYKEKDFKIIDIKYNFLGEPNFSFEVKEKNEDRVYSFIVSKDEKFEIEDGYVKYENASKEKEVNGKLIKFLKDNNLSEKYQNLKITINLNEFEEFELVVTKEEDIITEENTLEFAKIIASVINDVKTFELFKEFEQINISLRDKQNSTKNLTSYLYIERYLNDYLDITNDYEYIKKALNVEYID